MGVIVQWQCPLCGHESHTHSCNICGVEMTCCRTLTKYDGSHYSMCGCEYYLPGRWDVFAVLDNEEHSHDIFYASLPTV